ncbi:MAG: hypothetical protein IKJ35_07225 [Clostridia bacterium]|nr:hypothetical protein [Clostridia bacterium]
MNQQTTASTNPQARRQAPEDRRNAPVARRRGPDPKRLRLLYRLMLIVSGMIALGGLLLLILPSFRIKEIRVEGVRQYTEEEVDQIIQASGLEIGQEILALDLENSLASIYKSKNCDYIKDARIWCSPFSVRIEIMEEFQPKQRLYIEFNDKYYSLSRDFRVLGESEDASEFEDFLFVELPEVSALAVGSKLRFSDADLDLSYINEMIDRLEENGTLSQVTSLDVSGKHSVSYVMSDTCRVNFGKVGDSETKLVLVEEILARKGGIGETPSIIDVSNPQKPTYRQLSDSSLLMAG